MIKLKEKINSFLHSNYLFVVAAVFVFAGWFFKILELSYIPIILLGCLTFLCCTDVKPFAFLVAIAGCCYYRGLFDKFRVDLPYFTIFFLIIGPFCLLLIGCYIYYLVKNFIKPKKKLKAGSLAVAMLLGGIACLFGGLFTEEYTFIHVLAAVAIIFVCYLIYFILINGTGDDLKNYLYKILVTICILAMVETVIFYLPIDVEFMARIFNKSMNIGWAMTNSIATIYSITLPIILYHSLKAKNPWPDFVLFFFICLFLAFTLSRTSLLFAGILMPIVLVYAFIKTQNKKKTLIALGVSLCVIILLCIFFGGQFWQVIEVLSNRGSNLSGRAEIWEYCIKEFKKMPAFGLSFFGEDMSGFWYPNRVIHNTFLQILCCTGVVGFILFIPYFYKRYVLLIKNFSLFKVFALFSVFLWELGGIFDLNFIRVFQLIIIFIIMAACENETQGENYKINFPKRTKDEDVTLLDKLNNKQEQ